MAEGPFSDRVWLFERATKEGDAKTSFLSDASGRQPRGLAVSPGTAWLGDKKKGGAKPKRRNPPLREQSPKKIREPRAWAAWLASLSLLLGERHPTLTGSIAAGRRFFFIGVSSLLGWPMGASPGAWPATAKTAAAVEAKRHRGGGLLFLSSLPFSACRRALAPGPFLANPPLLRIMGAYFLEKPKFLVSRKGMAGVGRPIRVHEAKAAKHRKI